MHHIMFDVDGTLVESYQLDEKCFVDAIFSVLGHKIDMRWSTYRHVTDAGILDQHLGENGLLAARNSIHEDVKAAFTANIEKQLSHSKAKEINGAAKFIARLRAEKNVSISIATGGWRDTAIKKLNSAGIEITGLAIASSDDHYSRTEIMKAALHKAQISNEHKWTYFGDAEWDKLACKQLGINFVLVGERTEHYQRVEDLSCVEKAYQYIGLHTN